ncbi:metallophosphoesterase [Helcococcus massiliensis]|uniref:metallophosphoesterase n=1 Tax=Helcococcus massiliensis TaxID=2040290 RepID=UPI000CDED7B6|nr:metallophosphoesterase [Helcococcus massiliensis]
MIYIIAALLVFIIYVVLDNEIPRLTSYNFVIKDGKIKKIDDKCKLAKKYTIYQISDLHNHLFGKNQKRITKLFDENPDFIFLTGDMLDRLQKNIDGAMVLLETLSEKYPGKVYFVSGNHEKASPFYKDMLSYMEKNKIIVLDDKNIDLEDFNLLGLPDPSEYYDNKKVKYIAGTGTVESRLDKLLVPNKANLLLAHRPSYLESYSKCGADLVFSGHTHGGQFRIFNRGLIAPGDGLFPKFDGGLYKKNNTYMVNSRGLGNNLPIAKRIFNSPEICKINLYIDI